MVCHVTLDDLLGDERDPEVRQCASVVLDDDGCRRDRRNLTIHHCWGWTRFANIRRRIAEHPLADRLRSGPGSGP
jgi:hypothetical protein